MTAQEFISTCKHSGYCTSKTADMYVKKHNKDDYTIEDIQTVYRQEVRARELADSDHSSRYQYVDGAKTTKHYKYNTGWGG
jgi:hypothetical protein